MRRFSVWILTTWLLTACSDDALTWGELSLELGESYCAASASCGFSPRHGCAEHVQFHLCVPDDSCDVELPEEAQVAMDICDASLSELSDEECALLYWGYLPVECNPVFGFSPGPQ